MPYLELSFELGTLDREAAEAACFDTGALSLTFSDDRDDAVLEPLPGEVRLWRHTRVRALYDAAQADPMLVLQLAAQLQLAPERLQAQAIADRVWEREWLRDFHAMRFGRRLWICPRHEQVQEPQAVVVRLDPGLAFGTGTHPSTALCLQWLDGLNLEQQTLIDYGCGSGVLAIAALKLGAAHAEAFDIDPQALIAARDNASDNEVGERLGVHERADSLSSAPWLVANILAEVLVRLAPQLAALVTPGGQVLLAGILSEQAAEVADAFAKWFDMSHFAERDGWVALTGRRYK